MGVLSKKEAAFLLLGDLIIFLGSLFLALFLRRFEFPTLTVYFSHIPPFLILSLIWAVVFFIAGLYEKQTLLLRSKLPNTLFNAQVANAFFAIAFFYIVPNFGIEPKTNLFLFLIVSSVGLFLWRIYGTRLFGPRVKERALIVGSGEEVAEMAEEINNNSRYNLTFVDSVDLDRAREVEFKEVIIDRVYQDQIGVMVIDFDNKKLEPILAHLYNLIFSKVRFIDMHELYEELFDRMPLSLLRHSWFLENISLTPRFMYDSSKRLMDIIISAPLGILSLAAYPFVYVAIKSDDGGSVFFRQIRIGKNNQSFSIIKFRTMGKVEGKEKQQVTRSGKFLRASRIDELPQLWNVLRGDLSLIGPRPELPELVAVYEKEIPYYSVRHLVTPGLSGWAQIYHQKHPHHSADIYETRNKLSYDLYYIKNRSFTLDVKIALKTIKTLLSQVGV